MVTFSLDHTSLQHCEVADQLLHEQEVDGKDNDEVELVGASHDVEALPMDHVVEIEDSVQLVVLMLVHFVALLAL